MHFARNAKVCFILLILAFPAMAPAQDTLSGRYLGVQDGAGASIEIAPDSGGFKGVFYDSAGKSQSFEADRVGDSAEAVLDMDGRTVLLRMNPKPYGADVALVPFLANGELDPSSALALTFVHKGLDVPETPEDYVDPPGNTVRRFAANSFLASYEFWSPEGVRNGYMSLSSRFRTLMSLFPAVQLDIIFKLCLARDADEALATALRGQGVACSEVVDGMAKAQRNGSFAGFKQEVAAQRDLLRTTVRCGDGYLMSKTECDSAAAAVSRQATSLETSATVLQRYR